MSKDFLNILKRSNNNNYSTSNKKLKTDIKNDEIIDEEIQEGKQSNGNININVFVDIYNKYTTNKLSNKNSTLDHKVLLEIRYKYYQMLIDNKVTDEIIKDISVLDSYLIQEKHY